jgi:hypothetical protein
MLPAQTLYTLMLLLHVLHQEHHQHWHQTLAKKAPLANPLCVKRRENGDGHSFAAWGIVV